MIYTALITLFYYLIYIFNYYNILSNLNVLYLLLSFINFLFFNTLLTAILVAFFFRNFIITQFLILIIFFFYQMDLLTSIDGGSQWLVNLVYGFNAIHPFLFYISGILIFYLLFFFKIVYRFYIFLLTIISITALLLGMYWGSVNPGWGFFWSNDAIEYILVFLILIVAYLYHYFLLLIRRWIIQYIFIIGIFTLFLIRFNLFFSVHSFFINSQIKSSLLCCWLFLIIYKPLLLLCLYISWKSIFFFIFYLFIGYSYTSYEILSKHLNIYLLHLIIYLIVYFILFDSYYYLVLNLHNFFIIEFEYINYDLLWTYLTYLILDVSKSSSHINLTLYNNITSSSLYYSLSYYCYIFYMGYFYYLCIIFLISFYKIYIK